ncbi:MAG TPA: response regulator [Thermoleophilaceae bacterium]|nr:response regulator [Thermoleophilaceae bacterium]
MTRVLLVEDNEADVVLLREALREGGVDLDLTVAPDGEQAMAGLRNGGGLPDLVLLDLNLPRKDGREVLSEMKADPALAGVPVIVLTTSQSPGDVAFAYRNHANAYVRKPNGLDQLIEVTRAIRDFWVAAATLP